jgi:hypothetical protein
LSQAWLAVSWRCWNKIAWVYMGKTKPNQKALLLTTFDRSVDPYS